jgi:glycosyltransferase involved in cell wall biosynthesis
MKVAIVIWNLSISGGAQRQCLELARYISERGHEVKIYCAYLDLERCYPKIIKDLKVYSLYNKDFSVQRNPIHRFFYPLEILFFRKEAHSLVKLMDKDFNIVNTHDFPAFLVGYLYKKRNGGFHIWSVNDLPRYLLKPPLKFNFKDLLRLFLYPLRLGLIGRILGLKLIRTVDRVAVISKMVQEDLKLNTGLDSLIVGSGLDLSFFRMKEKKQSKYSEINILANGIFFPHRRFEDILLALTLLRKKGINFHLDIIGSEDYDKKYSNKIRKLVVDLDLENDVEFLGEVSEDELVRKYQNADVFVFPNFPQTWGLAVFEAMACGTPVIVCKGSGASEILTDGVNALLVSPAKPEEIANSIEKIINDKELRESLRMNGRRFVEENVSWKLYGEKMLKIFNNVCKGD